MFILDYNEPAPIYKQLYNQIREQVLSGKMPAHAKLPSVRDLAAELLISRNTVEGAYQELYAEGYIYSQQRSGYFVSALDQHAAPLSLKHQRRPQQTAGCGPPCDSSKNDRQKTNVVVFYAESGMNCSG